MEPNKGQFPVNNNVSGQSLGAGVGPGIGANPNPNPSSVPPPYQQNFSQASPTLSQTPQVNQQNQQPVSQPLPQPPQAVSQLSSWQNTQVAQPQQSNNINIPSLTQHQSGQPGSPSSAQPQQAQGTAQPYQQPLAQARPQPNYQSQQQIQSMQNFQQPTSLSSQSPSWPNAPVGASQATQTQNTHVIPAQQSGSVDDIFSKMTAPQETIITEIDDNPKKGKITKIVLLAILLLSAIAALVVFFKVYNDPTNVVNEAILKTLNTKKIGFSSKIMTEEDKFSRTVEVNFYRDISGQYEMTEKNMATIDGEKYEAKVEIKTSNKTQFLKIDNFENLAKIMLKKKQIDKKYQALAKAVNDRWFSLSSQEAFEITDSKKLSKNECANKYLTNIQSSEKSLSGLASLYTKNNFLTPESVGSEDINGVSSTHFKLKIDKDKFTNFIKNAEKSLIFKDVDTCYGGKLFANLNSFAKDQIQGVGSEIWTGFWSRDVKKVAIDFNTGKSKTRYEILPAFDIDARIDLPKGVVESAKDHQEFVREYFKLRSGGLDIFR